MQYTLMHKNIAVLDMELDEMCIRDRICGVLRENGGEIAMNLIGKVTFVGDDDILYDDAINTVYIFGQQNQIRFHFRRPKRRCCIRREEGIPRAAGKNDNPPLFQMPHSPPADIWLGNLPHFNGGLQPRLCPQVFQGVLQCQRVDHRCQHSHVVGRNAVHPFAPAAAPDISAAHGKADGGAQLLSLIHI